MKQKYFKSLIKKIALFSMGTFIFLATGRSVMANTSDEVTLSVSKPGAGYVNTVTSSLYVRSAPSSTASIITSLPSQSNVMIVERCGDFYKVQYDTYGHYGYMSSQYLQEYSLDHYHVANTGNNSLNMREHEGTQSVIVASIPSGRAFPSLTFTGDWNYALYGPQEGYVSNQYVYTYTY